MSKHNVVVIGNGMVGHRFIEELIDKAEPGQFALTVFCEEPRVAYDRVHLSAYFSHHTAEELSLVREGYYEKHQVNLLLGERAITINREEKLIHSNTGRAVRYDTLIFATGSWPWIPPIKGSEGADCFVYRTIEDLNAIEACARRSKRGAVIGGGLLGLEAAGALKNLGIETHVIEFAPVLMAEQLDVQGGEQLRRKIEEMGVQVHTSKNTQQIVHHAAGGKTLQFADGSALDVDFIVFSTGIRPQDKLAKQCGLAIGQRGGIAVDDRCRTSDPAIYAIGECAAWQNRVFGLVAPGYKMAQVASDALTGRDSAFRGADMSAKLKLLGVDVGGIGDAHGRTPGARSYVWLDESRSIYKRLIVSEEGKTLLGAVLVGDTSDYGNLLQFVLNAIPLPENPEGLILPVGSGEKPVMGVDSLPDSAQICSCFDVSKGDIIKAVQGGCHTVAALKSETRAGTGCGGCIPLLTQVLNAELSRQGIEVNNHLCAHFPYSRQELYHLIRVEEIKSFDALLAKYGEGYGCEVCKPTVASLLASCWNDFVLAPQHTPLQDSNDLFLGNIQKDGTYSVIPRSPGGEITPQGLKVIGEVAERYSLYTKITGSQRIGLFGAQKDDLPAIWSQLIAAGFETGQAYAKALRMAKTCVGSAWCRYGVGDSLGFGIALENRYKGIRTPHKMKFGVSGCTRECAEAQGKDVGIIATEKGWNLYVCGNGGMKPRHADLLAADLDGDTLIAYLDRFMMFYIRTGDRLQRTSLWLESLEGGIDYLRSVIIDDKLGINSKLEAELSELRARARCEWKEAVEDPAQQARFAHFINAPLRDPNVQMVAERSQHRPARPEERIAVTLIEESEV
ncbi:MULTISPECIES: nitrite reductase large subunit NirB [Pantoea]|jgi:nitrite reductase (NADH) large subunit|uniref:nitrite reductase large subunit NirB n=1 Tax=Pantoea TaxID=53335 RepID=UPI000EA1AD3B|nr:MULTISPECIES: nitrite reductase large subunit NirB [Pantoea]MDU6433117.1 nitrite reductase large subunit NirB [Pantoea sp.]MBZ6384678.1 nitrite reductase large subunit NirB [Pantoea piersonii]MBZ6401638.1 nitrite reductase large subunit NirB [Pantoea piersonii]MBZ6407283.1 nitrite reductase large subunit NirB [Pantoea piersonii]MBZ6426606.1 nitrite reductase large subunit NirB [Pantoea piersonii]